MKVDTLTPVHNHPHILCRFNLALDEGFIIRDITLMTGSKGKWINWPSRAYKDKEGKDKYFRYIELDAARKDKIEAEIKAQIDKFLAAAPPSTPSDQVPF